MNWQDLLIDNDTALRELLIRARTIAVLGIKTEAQSDQPAFYVPEYLQQAGLDVIPVPVYYPEVTEILGRPVVRTLAAIDVAIDIVDVFRKPGDLEAHVDDILTAKPYAVWLQSGIRNDAFAERLARSGIRVVQDRCLMVEHRRLMRDR